MWDVAFQDSAGSGLSPLRADVRTVPPGNGGEDARFSRLPKSQNAGGEKPAFRRAVEVSVKTYDL